MKNIVFIVGARPNFMKVAPILKEIQRKYSKKFNPILIHTGQHYDFNMSKIFFEQLKIPDPICFDIEPGTQAQQTSEVMNKFEFFLENNKSIDLVVVVGDVNSSLATAIVAAKANIPLIHVEAGLRSFDKRMPEEINRILIDSLSTLLFTTEPIADENLDSENYKNNVYRVGNVMIDSLKDKLPLSRELKVYEKYNLKKNKYILVTLHRPSNVDDEKKFKSILNTIQKVAENHEVIFLTHPRTQKKMRQYNISLKNILRIAPIGYIENLNLMENAKLVITDSGGIQEETTYLGIPCVTLRKSTERPITTTLGTNIIAGENEELYEEIIKNTLKNKINKINKIPLWDGKTSERIMEIIDRKY